MVNVQNLSFSYTGTPILEGVNFSIGENMKIGLVGPNGAGKTTLLNILAKKELPNEGKVDVVGTIGLVPQEVKSDQTLDGAVSVREYLDPQGFRQDYELQKMLSGLELENLELERSPKDLSGGQKTRLALARALFLEPDVLLLDEPTNFMDVNGKKWVMGFLSHYPKTLIVISHDLNLLDQAVNKVLYVNTQTKKIDEYSGNYSQFVRLKGERDALLTRQVINEQKHIKKMEESVAKLMSNRSAKGVKQRVVMQRRVERAKESLPELPAEVKRIKLRLQEPAWIGELPIRAKEISKSYGDKKILNGVNFSLNRGERLVILGKNGAGKSTFIKILMGLLQSDSGEILRNDHLKVGYYSQEFETFDMQKSLIETVRENCHLPERDVRPILAKFLFPGDKVYQSVGTLSGGEKTRLSIAMLMLHDYNLLVLDEPTTYLDVLSQKIILDVLKEYKGTMILVSHTEEFVKDITPDKALLLPENKEVFWSDELLDNVGDM